jgi:hypothetical protein
MDVSQNCPTEGLQPQHNVRQRTGDNHSQDQGTDHHEADEAESDRASVGAQRVSDDCFPSVSVTRLPWRGYSHAEAYLPTGQVLCKMAAPCREQGAAMHNGRASLVT